MADSDIEWTDKVWNPVRGCTKVSPGCKYCYAETFAERWRGVPGHAYEQGFDLRLVPEKLSDPVRWRRGKKIFVNSMSDLFQTGVPFEYVDRVFGVMAATQFLGKHAAPGHTYQLLTKRADLLAEYLSTDRRQAWARAAVNLCGGENPDPLYDFIDSGPRALPNVWAGVSVENRKHGLPRVDVLRGVDAAVRWLSIEPLLEDLGTVDLRGIHWVVVGGESGQRARPFDLAWARSIRDQCKAAGVPFFFKQAGAKPHDAGALVKLKAKKGGKLDELPPDLQSREFPR